MILMGFDWYGNVCFVHSSVNHQCSFQIEMGTFIIRQIKLISQFFFIRYESQWFESVIELKDGLFAIPCSSRFMQFNSATVEFEI